MKPIFFKVIFTFNFLLSSYVLACDACKLQQPKITKNIAHGVGPESNWDFLMVGIIAVGAAIMLILSFKYLLCPKEKNTNHIKYSILSNQSTEP